MTELVVERPSYRLELGADGGVATLSTAEGALRLRLLAALDTDEGRDETVGVEPPRALGDGTFEVTRRSTRWERAALTLGCGDDAVDLRTTVAGTGRLTDAHLLGGRTARGFVPSGSTFETLFSPNPEDPGRILRTTRERVAIGVVGDGQPGRGHWFFTPAPLCFALGPGWLTVGLAAPVDELTFTQAVYEGADRAFSLRLEYEGHTEVRGEFEAPTVVLTPGVGDPYAGLRRHRERVSGPPRERERPAWWSEPSFCGWGAQCALGDDPKAESTQANYDRFLEHLDGHGLVPGVIVVDDKWQAAYGTCEPDESKWPDLRSWIAGRHEDGQHVLLWWKAWDPEGMADELCVRDADGRPVALDPTNPAAREALADAVARLLGPEGLDADGLKVDFTARTPSGSTLTAHGPGWGIALLHRLLAVVYGAAKDAKRDALVLTHTPHPSFVDVADMIRLNDMLRLDDPGPPPQIVPQMRYRAEVVRATCPELLIDTDDWCAPDLEQWRAYLDVKSLLGVPSLYYAQSLDTTGEIFEARDYEALRRVWEQWRATSH